MLTKKSLLLIVVGLVTGAFNTLGTIITNRSINPVQAARLIRWNRQNLFPSLHAGTIFLIQAALKPASYLLILLLIPFTNRKFQNEHEGSFNPFLLIIPITFEPNYPKWIDFVSLNKLLLKCEAKSSENNSDQYYAEA